MQRWLKWTLITAGLFIASAMAAGGWYIAQAGPVASGFVAKYICSSTFVSLRDPKTVFTQDVVPTNPMTGLFNYTIDREHPKVTASLSGCFPRTAIYRKGCGCSLVVGTTEEKMRLQPLVKRDFDPTRLEHRPGRPWPDGNDGPINPERLGVDALKLKAALDEAFAEPFQNSFRQTRAVVVVYKGRLMAERYAEGIHRDMPLMGWSMSKSVTNALTGIMVQQGALDILQPAPVARWRGDPEKSKITVDQLLRMSSGLAFDEIYQPPFDSVRMLYASYSFSAYAAAKPLESEPDAKWQYSSGTSNILSEVLRRKMEKNDPYYFQFIYDRLFNRIGMYSAVMEPDASGTFVGSSYTLATALDWARFGLLYLQDGVWQGERILPVGWVDYTVTPTPKAPRGRYGAHFWLNAGAPQDPTDRPWPNAPRDTFAALGYQGQNLIVIPSRQVVLVRLGATADRNAWNTDRFIRQVLTVLPSD